MLTMRHEWCCLHVMETQAPITDLQSVFAAFGSNVKLASVLRVGPSAVSEMKRRNNIPVEYWPSLVDGAREIGRSDLTMERMAFLSAEAALAKRETAA